MSSLLSDARKKVGWFLWNHLWLPHALRWRFREKFLWRVFIRRFP